MKHKITKLMTGVILIGGIQAAKAFNPGIYYYQNEETKAMRQEARAKAVEEAGDRYRSRTRKHRRITSKSYNLAIKQDRAYRNMLYAQADYYDAAKRVTPYPEYDYHSESVHATRAQNPYIGMQEVK